MSRGSVVSFDGLTRDNTLLLRPTIEPPEGRQRAVADALGRPTWMLVSAVDCTDPLRADVEAYVQAGIAPATRRAYRADLSHFEAWGGTIPATDAPVAAYLADHAAVLKVSTLKLRCSKPLVTAEKPAIRSGTPTLRSETVENTTRRRSEHEPKGRAHVR
jgi:hypothetical protein